MTHGEGDNEAAVAHGGVESKAAVARGEGDSEAAVAHGGVESEAAVARGEDDSEAAVTRGEGESEAVVSGHVCCIELKATLPTMHKPTSERCMCERRVSSAV